MRLYQPRVLATCAAAGILLGGLGGLLAAAVTGGPLVTGLASGIIVLGAIVFIMGMLAAVEPPGGWASTNARKKDSRGERRSVVTKIAFEFDAIDTVTSWDLAAWACVVGGGMVGLGILVYTLGS